MNDSFRSRHLFVKYAPEKIACGCIFLACRVLQIATPSKPNWFEVLDAEPAEVFQIAQHIMSLYTFEKVRPPCFQHFCLLLLSPGVSRYFLVWLV